MRCRIYQIDNERNTDETLHNIILFITEDFMFQMTDEEMEIWKSQIVMTNSIKMGIRRNPFVFTELGVSMLSSVLNSKIAIQINIGIMRAFVAARQLITNQPTDRVGQLESQMKELKEYIEEVFADYNDINDDTRMQLELINQTVAELQVQKKLADKPRKRIGFI